MLPDDSKEDQEREKNGDQWQHLFTRNADGSVGRRPLGEFSYAFHFDNIFRHVYPLINPTVH
jgi:hypothetical protein